MKLHSISMKGIRDENEDVILVKKSKKTGEIMAACFDGHGGGFVSDYLGKHFFKKIAGIYEPNQLSAAVQAFHNEMALEYPQETFECGSTVLLVRILPNGYLQTLHLGDSRAVLYDGSARQLTEDHSPDSPSERLRLTKESQEVVYDREDEVYRVNGYSVSRAIGDDGIEGISHIPVVSSYKLTGDTKYIILACDGCWDTLTIHEACDFINKVVKSRRKPLKDIDVSHTSTNLAFSLAKEALQRGSTDNVSVIILFFF